MGIVTVAFGLVLIVLGIVGFVGTGSTHYTALIPALFGLLLVIFGALGHSDNAKKRMLFMHIAVTVGLLGFLGTVKSLFDYWQLLHGKIFPYPAAVEAKSIMSILCLLFVLLCVRSFIAARQARA